jgi:hypothetical protein
VTDAIDLVNEAELERDPFVRAQYLDLARRALPELDNPELEGKLSQRISDLESLTPPTFVGPKPYPNRVR